MTPLMSTPEVRAWLGISASTLVRLVKKGLPYAGEGRLRRYQPDSVWRWYAGADSEPAADKPGGV